MVWQQIIIQVAIAAVAYMLTPKPKSASVTPGEVDTPVVETGTPHRVIFGTKWVTNPHLVWEGNVKTTAIRK